VYRHVARKYSSALISQDRLTVIWINLNSFCDAVSARSFLKVNFIFISWWSRLRFRSRSRDRRPIFSTGSRNQLHQDLEGVDGHRPNLWQEVGGLDVRKLVNLIQQCNWNKLMSLKMTTEKWWNKTSLKYFFFIKFVQAWLSNIFVKTLGPFISAYKPLINKRALICDHSQFVNICLLFEKNICC
jgi:hypothetical protein